MKSSPSPDSNTSPNHSRLVSHSHLRVREAGLRVLQGAEELHHCSSQRRMGIFVFVDGLPFRGVGVAVWGCSLGCLVFGILQFCAIC
jgi:hypothetical protein